MLAVGFDLQGNVVDSVYYAKLEGFGGHVTHSGDNRTGEGTVTVCLVVARRGMDCLFVVGVAGCRRCPCCAVVAVTMEIVKGFFVVVVWMLFPLVLLTDAGVYSVVVPMVAFFSCSCSAVPKVAVLWFLCAGCLHCTLFLVCILVGMIVVVGAHFLAVPAYSCVHCSTGEGDDEQITVSVSMSGFSLSREGDQFLGSHIFRIAVIAFLVFSTSY